MRVRTLLIRIAFQLAALAAFTVYSRQVTAQPGTGPFSAIPTAQAVIQENGATTTMPNVGPRPSRDSGLWLTVDTYWASGYGYRPIQVSVKSPKPTTADHLITIKLHFGYEYEISVEQDFEIKTGASSASTIVALPTYGQMLNYYWWDVFVDGEKDEDLSLDPELGWRSAVTMPSANVGGLQILVASPDANHRSLVSPSVFDFQVLSWKLSEFPKRWIDYTCLDVVSLTLPELQQLAQSNPLAFEAIERWVRCGGQLWVTDVGDELEKLPEVSKLLGLSGAMLPVIQPTDIKTTGDNKSDKADVAKAEVPAMAGWGPSRRGGSILDGELQGFTDTRTGRTRWTRDPRAIAQLDRDQNFVRTPGQGLNVPVNPEQQAMIDPSKWYVEQRLGLGLVWAFRGGNEAAEFAHRNPVNASVAANSNVAGSIPPELAIPVANARQWETRHGMLPDANCADFAKYMFPDLGRAPVLQFQVLITLFVVMIGPFNYWILKRYKRLQMLVLTVPISAGLATLALFAYAIISDGFGTTVRARSVTMLDQRTGEAASWARLSYYSGMAPGRGLTLPADVAIYPVLPNWSSDPARSISRELVWNEHDGNYTRGWLLSRTPTQYLTLCSRKTSNKLEIVSGAGKMQVTNRLGTPIEYLVVINEKGNFFGGEPLAKKARAILHPVSREDATKEFGQIIRDHPFEPPAELAGNDRDFTNKRRSARRGYGRYRAQPSIEQPLESLADRTISDLAGLNGGSGFDLPPRSYVAVTTSGVEVETGIQRFTEQASFHVVVGQW